jgi:hypothetical protein
MEMPLDLASIAANIPTIGGAVGIVGGTIGAIAGVAGFARRKLRLVVTVTQNNDAHNSWHIVTIANRSDLALTLSGFILSWFITTPVGRLELNRAYEPEEDHPPTALAPHSAVSFTISDDGPGDDVWREVQPLGKRPTAYLRMYVVIPALGGGRWFPVLQSTWRDASLRERWLSRWYGVNRASLFEVPPARLTNVDH